MRRSSGRADSAMLAALPRLEHRQLRSAGRARLPPRIRAALRPGDALLLGADLVKPEPELLLAYDDPLGVTAAFNKNLLVRMNTELLADFDLDAFRASRRLEPAGVARRDAPRLPAGADVRIPRAETDVRFAPGSRSGPRAPTSTRRTGSS